MTYEAWRISYQSSEQAAQALYPEMQRPQASRNAESAELDRLRSENERLRDALEDCAGGLLYVRETYGDLYGVGFDRALAKAYAALTPNAALSGPTHNAEPCD